MRGTFPLLALLPACVISDEPVKYEPLSGTYDASYQHILANTCFPTEMPIPAPLLFALGIDEPLLYVDAEVPEPIPASMTGGISSASFGAVAERLVVVTTACTLRVDTRIDGLGISPDEVGLTFTIGFDAYVYATDGAVSRCAEMSGETFHGLPFPSLSDPENGECAATVKGFAVRRAYDPW